MRTELEKKQKTVRQALREVIEGYDVINNLKFLVIAFFGLFGFTNSQKNPQK